MFIASAPDQTLCLFTLIRWALYEIKIERKVGKSDNAANREASDSKSVAANTRSCILYIDGSERVRTISKIWKKSQIFVTQFLLKKQRNWIKKHLLEYYFMKIIW